MKINRLTCRIGPAGSACATQAEEESGAIGSDAITDWVQSPVLATTSCSDMTAFCTGYWSHDAKQILLHMQPLSMLQRKR